MGKLRTLTIPRTEIDTGFGVFSVRGISVDDITLAAIEHGPQIALLFARLQSEDAEMAQDIRSIILTLGREFPDLIAAIISLAADDYSPESVRIARELPFPKQAEAVEAIFRNTFTSEADVKKLVESLARMIVGVSGALTEVRLSASEIGIGDFAER
jgi:L-fucose mutarotase/ribose pyranase (RbsD/FucU family)